MALGGCPRIDIFESALRNVYDEMVFSDRLLEVSLMLTILEK